jgi:hypothetical protein
VPPGRGARPWARGVLYYMPVGTNLPNVTRARHESLKFSPSLFPDDRGPLHPPALRLAHLAQAPHPGHLSLLPSLLRRPACCFAPRVAAPGPRPGRSRIQVLRLRGPPSRAIGGWPLRVSLPAIYYWIVQNNTLSHVLIRVIYDPRVVLNPQSPFYREEMRALRIGIVLFGILGCVQSLDTIGFMVKRVVSPEQSLTPMKIGGSEFVSPERGRNLYRRSSIIQSGCPDSAQCNISFNFSEVKRVGLED